MYTDSSDRTQRTFDSGDNFSFELEDSLLNHPRIPQHADNIFVRKRGDIHPRSTLVGQELTGVALAWDASRSNVAVDWANVCDPDISESTTRCRKSENVGKGREQAERFHREFRGHG